MIWHYRFAVQGVKDYFSVGAIYAVIANLP